MLCRQSLPPVTMARSLAWIAVHCHCPSSTISCVQKCLGDHVTYIFLLSILSDNLCICTTQGKKKKGSKKGKGKKGKAPKEDPAVVSPYSHPSESKQMRTNALLPAPQLPAVLAFGAIIVVCLLCKLDLPSIVCNKN